MKNPDYCHIMFAVNYSMCTQDKFQNFELNGLVKFE